MKKIPKKEMFYDLAIGEFQKRDFDDVSMRELARLAGVSLGSFYYYFPSKEALIGEFYSRAFDDLESELESIKGSSKKFSSCFESLILYRIDSFKPYRNLLISLSRSAVDPRSELSPFSEGTKNIRDKMIYVIEDLIEHCGLKYDSKLGAYIPYLLWMYLMGMVFFWIFDSTLKQTKTSILIKGLTPMVTRLVSASQFKVFRPVTSPIAKLLEQLF